MTYLLIVIALHFNSRVVKVVETVSELRRNLKSSERVSAGFVPTMGALHQGHISLVKSAVAACPVVTVSIYVNPTQFNDKEDLRKYPRTIDSDLALLGSYLRKDDIVFTPSDKEIYPEKDTRVFDFGNLGNVMEALHRPGHFNGVAQVVSRLFDLVQPDIAWFGQKDFQQLAIVRELVKQLGYKIKIIAGPIIREADGLAMSSRNMLLDPEIRANAPVIFKTISAASLMIKDHEISEIKWFVKDSIERKNGFRVEYYEIADDEKLVIVNERKQLNNLMQYYGCIAVMAGKIRLIDNIRMALG